MAKKVREYQLNLTPASSLAREMVEGQTELQQGWALSKPRTGGVRFSPKVHEYVIMKFDLGELTGNKVDPLQVASDMRNSRSESGDRHFTREEWLTKTQIKGFFSHLAKLRKKEAHVSQKTLKRCSMMMLLRTWKTTRKKKN